MSGDKRYWAFVGRPPELENASFAIPYPCDLKEALALFESKMQLLWGLRKSDVSKNRRAYGAPFIIDAVFSSKTPIELEAAQRPGP